MSTVQGTDELAVLRYGTLFRAPVSRLWTLDGGDTLAICRGGTDYSIPQRELISKPQNTDFLAVGRGGVDYKATWADVAAAATPLIVVHRIWMTPESLRDRTHSLFHLEFDANVPWFPRLVRFRWYFEIKVGTTIVYAHGSHYQDGDTNQVNFWGSSDQLVDIELDQSSYVTFHWGINFTQAKGNVFKTKLSIPYRWNYHNRVPHPVTDQWPLQFVNRFPVGTQIRVTFVVTDNPTGYAAPIFTSPWFDLPLLQP